MSERPIDALDADVRPFVEAEKDHPEQIPREVRARLVAGVRARLAAGGGGSSSGPGEDGRNGGAGGGGGLDLVRAHPLASLLLALCIGGAGGALLRGLWVGNAPAMERLVYVERAQPTSSEVASTASANAAEVSPPPLSTTSARSAGSGGLEADESAERLVLDTARQALLRGDAPASWAAIQQHEHKFPRGALTEERDALAVRALVALGRPREAQARVDALRKRSPHSVFLPAAVAAMAAPSADAGT